MLNSKFSGVAKVMLGACLIVMCVSCDSDGDADLLSSLVVVADQGFTDLQITDAANIISVGETENFVVSALNAEGSMFSVDGASWSSSDNTVATVSSAGVVTGGATDGEATITARFGNLQSSRSIRVSSAPLSEIRVLFNTADVPDVVEINQCGSAQFQAQGIYLGEEGEPRELTDDVTWLVNPPNAIYDPVTSGLLRVQGPGTLEVTANLAGIAGAQTVSIRDDNLQALIIRPDDGVLAFGSPLQYRAFAQYADTGEADVTDNVDWDVDDDATRDFANVDNTLPSKGLLTPVRSGEGTLLALCGSVTARAPISALGGPIDEIEVDQRDPLTIIYQGDEILFSLTASGNLQGEFVLDVTEDSDWNVESVDGLILLSDESGSKGELTINGPGRIVIRVTYTDDDGMEWRVDGYTVNVVLP